MTQQPVNPEAEQHLQRAMFAALNENDADAIVEYEAALRLGLAPDDEMKSRFFLGECYASFIVTERSAPEIMRWPELHQAIGNMEKAIILDRDLRSGYFFVPMNRGRLKRLDLYYAMVGESLNQLNGPDAATSYYESKLPLFDHFPSNPLLTVLLQIGVLYGNHRHDVVRARQCFEMILRADTVVPEDQGEAQLKQMALNNLRNL